MTMQEFSQALGTMDPAELALGAGLAGALLAIMGVLAVAWFFISALGYYKMFRKAGQRSWMAFIPLLQEFVRFKMAWSTKLFWVYLAVNVVFQLCADGEALALTLVALATGIFLCVLKFKLCVNTAKCFGKTKGWGVLLFFFPFVVSLILGFGKAEYIGNVTAAAQESAN